MWSYFLHIKNIMQATFIHSRICGAPWFERHLYHLPKQPMYWAGPASALVRDGGEMEGNHPGTGSLHLCANWPSVGHKCACICSNSLKQTPWGWHEGLTSKSRGWAFDQHHAGRLAFSKEHQDWQIHQWHPVLFTDERRFLQAYVTDVTESGDTMENIMMPATFSSRTVAQ